MDDHLPRARARDGRRRILAVVGLSLAMVSVSTAAYSLALFTTATTVNGNSFGNGTLVLSSDHTSTAVIGFSNMIPGDWVTAPLAITNGGTAALRYSMSTSVSGETSGMGSQLQLQIKTADSGGGCSAFNGTLLYGNSDPAETSGTPAVESLSKPINAAFLGDPAQGNQSGDRILAGSDNGAPTAVGTPSRANAASGSAPSSETLCFRAYLPRHATGNSFQGAAVVASFAFAAEQAANNP